jgi:hypothetical protein
MDFRGLSAEPAKTNEPKARERPTREFVYLLLGPVIWLLHFTAVYAMQSILCAVAWPIHLAPAAIITGTALALVMVVILTLRRRRCDDGHSSSSFVRRIMRVLSLLSTVAIIWGCFAALLLHPCAPLR